LGLSALRADAADDSALAVTKDAFYFLQENGYINFGVLPGEPTAGCTACVSWWPASHNA
jgi:hypothetical protein